jgi:hypothetical protein
VGQVHGMEPDPIHMGRFAGQPAVAGRLIAILPPSAADVGSLDDELGRFFFRPAVGSAARPY